MNVILPGKNSQSRTRLVVSAPMTPKDSRPVFRIGNTRALPVRSVEEGHYEVIPRAPDMSEIPLLLFCPAIKRDLAAIESSVAMSVRLKNHPKLLLHQSAQAPGPVPTISESASASCLLDDPRHVLQPPGEPRRVRSALPFRAAAIPRYVWPLWRR
jgi:hypothetical protein